jgi:hypothetical protein
LRAVGADDVDVQLAQAELGDRLIRRRLAVDPEYAGLFGIERDWSAVGRKVGPRRGKI